MWNWGVFILLATNNVYLCVPNVRSSGSSSGGGRRPVPARDYDVLVSPRSPQNGSGLSVTSSLTLKTLLDVNLSRQTLRLRAWFQLEWRDERLSWNATELGVLSLPLGRHTVWVPEVIVYNTVNSLDEVVDSERGLLVRHDGLVTWNAGGTLNTFCSMDISYFPLDSHGCTVDLTTWSYSMLEVNLTFSPQPLRSEALSDGGVWSLITGGVSTSSSSARYKTLRFHFRLKRKALFYVVNVLFPLLLVSVLNCVVVRLPRATGEKVTVCLTTFLAFLTYLKATVDALPRNSDTLCYFGLYLALQLLNSVCAVSVAAAAEWLHWTERLDKHTEATENLSEDRGCGNIQFQRDSDCGHLRIPGDRKYENLQIQEVGEISDEGMPTPHDARDCGSNSQEPDTLFHRSTQTPGDSMFTFGSTFIHGSSATKETRPSSKLFGRGGNMFRGPNSELSLRDSKAQLNVGGLGCCASRVSCTPKKPKEDGRKEASCLSHRVEKVGIRLNLIFTLLVNVLFFLLLVCKHLELGHL